MPLFIVATLWIVGLVAAVLFAIGVPFFFGLMAFDLISQRRRSTEPATESAPAAEPARPMPHVAVREYGRIA